MNYQQEQDYRTKFNEEYNMVNLKNRLGPDPIIHIGFSTYEFAPEPYDDADETPHHPYFQDEHEQWNIALLNQNTMEWCSIRCDLLTDRWVNCMALTLDDMYKLYNPGPSAQDRMDFGDI